MVHRFAARQDANPRSLDDAEIERLLEITGNYAGLLRAVFFASQHGELALHPNAITLLVNQDSVWDECQKIWDSLDKEEQNELQVLASGQAPNGIGLRRLRFHGLVVERQDGTYAIFSPLFLAFVSASMQSARELVGPIIVLRPGSSTVTIDGRIINLDPVEVELFRLMQDRRPRACSRAELIEALLRAEAGQHLGFGGPERRLEKALAKIRSKIEIPVRTYLIPTEEGGYRLIGQDGK